MNRVVALTAILLALQLAHSPPFSPETGVLNRETPEQRRRAKLVPAKADLMGTIVNRRGATILRIG